MIYKNFLILFCIVASSCQMNPISADNLFVNVVDKKFITKKDIFISGVTLSRNYDGGIDRYVVSKTPGSGPEYLQRKIIPSGSVIYVEDIKSWKTLGFLNFEVKVQIETVRMPDNIPVFLGDFLKKSEVDQLYYMDSEFFVPLNIED